MAFFNTFFSLLNFLEKDFFFKKNTPAQKSGWYIFDHFKGQITQEIGQFSLQNLWGRHV